MWKVALRPRWIAALVLALAVAAGFALLSQWQLARSISTGEVVERPTETVLALTDIATPQTAVRVASDGQKVSATGDFVPGDYLVLSERYNNGVEGFWVVGHLTTANGAGVAVGLGWAETRADASTVVQALTGGAATVIGRYVADEAPQSSDFQNGKLSALSTATLVNLWPHVDTAGTYNGYIVASEPPTGLQAIDSPPPVVTVELNWLNIFYAAEWVIFAGFAIFLWWRLVRDVWEKERATESVD